MKILTKSRSIDMLAVGVLTVGIVTVATVLYSQWLMTRTFDRDAVLIRLSDAVQQKIAVAHLWFEEALAGDQSIDLERDVYRTIDTALELITAGLQGGNAGIGHVEPVMDKQARLHMLALQKTVRRWRGLTNIRWQGRETIGRIGEAQDQAYDAIFQEILGYSQKVAHDMDKVVAQERAALERINGAIILFLLVLFTGVAIVELRHRREIVAKNAELETRVKERTAQLSESEARIRALVENAVDGIITIDERGKIEMFNSAAARIFGYTPEEIIGKNVNMLMPSPHREGHDKYIANYLRTGEKKTIGIGREVQGLRKDGTTFPMDLAVNDVCLDEKWVFFGMVRDITDRKRVEAELQKTKEAAEAANRAKSEFLANMSHEIRTPMNGVIGMNHLLLDTGLDKEQFEYADAVRISAEALLSLINDILDFSKIEAGKLELENIDFALAEVVEGVADMIAPKAHDKGLELLVSIDDSIPPFLHGDPTRIRQVLLNLAGNAVKFTEKGEIIIKAELQSAECGMRSGEWGAVSNQYSVISKQDKTQTEAIACGHEVKGEEQGNSPDSSGQPEKNSAFQTPKSEIHNVIRFSVTDTGIGIPKEKQHLVFESFSQADGSTTRKYGGTGLGLTISKQLAMLMGGEIGVESPALPSKTFKDGRGKGSTFWFTVRLATHPRSEKARKGVPADISALEGRRMLVIDDNATNRLILKKALENHGCMVETAKSGRAALQMLQEKCDKCATFDFILLDMMMPEMDGKETARRIRESGCADSPIIVMASSAGTKPAKEEMQQLSIRHYLTKPIKVARLTQVLLESLGGEPSEPGPAKVTVVTEQDLRQHDRPSLHVLVAEDNPVNQKLTKRLLEKNGMLVEVVADGAKAVTALETGDYGLVLMDMHMPVMDGFAATATIREKEKSIGGHIPIIALTANAMKGDRERCLAAGMDGYVSKPIRKEELFNAIEKIVEARIKTA